MADGNVSAEMQNVGAGDTQQVWLKSIEDELKRKESYGSFSTFIMGHSIHRVPRQLREVNTLAYEPMVVAIGPYKKSRKLQPSVTESFMRISAAKLVMAMLNIEAEGFQAFTQRVVGDQHSVEKLAMEYERAPPYGEDALRAVFALDACFVTCFLVFLGCGGMSRRSYFPWLGDTFAEELARRVEKEFKVPKRLVTSILRDVFLFENQIPLSLVKGIMTSIINTGGAKAGTDMPEIKQDNGEEKAEEFLGRCIEEVVECANPFRADATPYGGITQGAPCIVHRHTHLLDCLYSTVTMDSRDERVIRSRVQSAIGITRGSEMQGAAVAARMGSAPTAVESAVHLRRAGIAFKPSATVGGTGVGGGNVVDIWFDKASATLFLPRLRIGPDSEAVLRNLAAYEMVALQRAEVGCYLALMDDLIDTAQDVQVLRLSGVLEHSLRNDEELAEMWNGMCKNLQVLYETSTLAEAYAAIKDHLCRRMRYKKLWELYAEFSNRYLSAPWLTASVLAATLLLVLTIAQTIYSAAIYYKS
ncbi:hypothetical protein KP509_30G007100 [Ceratopteris richardii]|uniref:Uncharacterized protein n=1 Tax=Ceratopteris richardii TaxID=49495 RepID=A0A8T2R0R7_CERRI|nr:hypothetical protein KP509_30G007100 [Ceratopteris richardii]